MRRFIGAMMVTLFVAVGCAQHYQAKPLPFKAPGGYANTARISGATVGAKAWMDKAEAQKVFGFDIIGAGMLPVQVVVDNQGEGALVINGAQSFAEDDQGNLWPVLSRTMAYERAAKFAKTGQVFKGGAYKGFLGAVAGLIVGAAVGIVSGDNVGEALGKGAAAGAAAGAVLGGAEGLGSNKVQSAISADLRSKSLQNKPVASGALVHGFLFYPAEAGQVRNLRLQMIDQQTKKAYVRNMPLK